MARSSKQSTVLPEVDGEVQERPSSRRDLLKTAGAAVAGAAASGLAMQGINASAATGSLMVVGVQNDENSTTSLVASSGSTLIQMFRAVGAGQANANILDGAIQAIGATGGEGMDAVCNGSQAWAFYGQTDVGIAHYGVAHSSGIGALGTSFSGYGVYGSSGSAVAVAAAGTGRLQQTPNIAAGPPAYLPLSQEQVRDTNGVLWLSNQGFYANGWAPSQPGASFAGGVLAGSNYTAVTNLQYHLTNSDGATWVPIDPVNLKITFTPAFNAVGMITANTSLWTDTAGFNQDIAIFVNGVLLAWEESGGFAGTFSPNAAVVHAEYGSFLRGITYTIDLRWKANHSGNGFNNIFAGAGPLPGTTSFSPTRLTLYNVIIG